MPDTEEVWHEVIEGFNDKCNFPLCGGAIDGKHVVIRCPPNSQSDYFNYKKNFSIVPIAVCDSNLIFRYINVGHYGRASDSANFAGSNFKQRLEEEQKVFNYRLSRSRMTFENTFGILVSKFRLFKGL
nr:unnamed protein product [Callosobruchus analis]